MTTTDYITIPLIATLLDRVRAGDRQACAVFADAARQAGCVGEHSDIATAYGVLWRLDRATCADCAAVWRYVQSAGDLDALRDLRRHASGPRARYLSWYQYTTNTGQRRERGPTDAAIMIVDVARRLGWAGELEVGSTLESTGSWCGNWPRTASTIEAEQRGEALVDDAIDYLRRLAGA